MAIIPLLESFEEEEEFKRLYSYAYDDVIIQESTIGSEEGYDLVTLARP